jgi:hypothetical protein
MSNVVDPFRYFNSSPEIIRLVLMMYVRFPLSLRNVEHLLFQRGIMKITELKTQIPVKKLPYEKPTLVTLIIDHHTRGKNFRSATEYCQSSPISCGAS